MGKHFVSDEWKLGCRGHENFEFVDVNLNDDNLLFIDPCLLEKCSSSGAKGALEIMYTFFNKFYRAYCENNESLKFKLLNHAGEQNAIHLGYGHPRKGNTASGLMTDFKPLERLIRNITTIGIPQDIPVLIPGFAEDGLSDLFTNILHKELNEFTVKQMEKHGIHSNGTSEFYYWNSQALRCELITRPSYLYMGKETLVVPKNIVRKNYLFGAGQYFERVILERLREEEQIYDSDGKPIPKKEISNSLKTDDEHWMYDYVIDYSEKHNDALSEYHKKLPSFYAEYGKPMLDGDLDTTIYSKR